MVAIDNLVVVTALPVIRDSFRADIEGLQWIVSAYTLTYAVFQLSSAALGDRFGRRRRSSPVSGCSSSRRRPRSWRRASGCWSRPGS
jgi:MFS family permease